MKTLMHFLVSHRVLVLTVLAFVSCSGLRLSYPLRNLESDVPTFTRNTARDNNTPAVPGPPLTVAWEQDVTAGFGNGAPLLVDSVLFVGNLRGELYAFSALSGKRLGWTTLGGAIHGSPVIDGNLSIVPIAGSRETLIAYDLVEGKIRWRQSIGDVHGSPLLLETRVFVGTTQGVLYCFSRADGERLWSYELPNNTTLKGIWSSPAGIDQTVIFGADDGGLYHLNARSGKLVWRLQTDGPIQASPTLHNGTVFVSTLGGTVYAVDRASGKTRWTFAAGSAIYGTLLVDSLTAVVGTTGGAVVALDTYTGMLVWRCDLDEPVNSGALGAGPYIYVGTLKKSFIALDRRTGTEVWRTIIGGRIKTTPIAGSGRVYVAGDDRVLLAFRSEHQ